MYPNIPTDKILTKAITACKAGHRAEARAMLEHLLEQDPHYFKTLEDQAVRDELYPRMKASGLKTNGFKLPVVDVNGYVLIRPSVIEVEEKYQSPTNSRALVVG